jgi:membrane protein
MSTGAIAKLKRIYDATHAFVTEKGIELHEESRATWFYRFAHFWLLAVKSFIRNRCPSRATALAYTTLLALVPLLAVGVSIASTLLQGQGREKTEEMIVSFISTIAPQLELIKTNERGEKVDGRKEAARWLTEKIDLISKTSLGIGGMLGLTATAILLLSTIEGTFNDIWGVTRGRSWFARVVQYWAAISLLPVAVVLVGVLQTGPHFQSVRDWLAKWPLVVQLAYYTLPFVMISLAFALFYKLMPNTQVTWRAALSGGIVGGCLWLLNYISLNAMNLSKIKGAQTIYSNLGIVMILIFLIGIYFSWLIVLFGAQVAYAAQNREVYLQEKKAESVHQRGREFIALRIMACVARRFEQQAKPMTRLELASELAVPSRLVGRVLGPLVQNRLIVEVMGRETGYAPARPLEAITCQDILQTLRAGGGQELETRDEPGRAVVREEFQRIQEAEAKVASRITVKDLVNRLPPLNAPDAERSEGT